MPKAEFTRGAYRESSGPEKFPPLEFKVNGEVARIWVPDPRLGYMEWVHTIKAPVFGDDGKPLMEQRSSGKNATKMVYATNFIGRPICLGDPDVLAEKGLDTGACPVCRKIQELLDDGVSDAWDLRPQARYSMPVIRYETTRATDPNSLRMPPSAKVCLWNMSQWTYHRLDDAFTGIAELLDKDVDDVSLKMADLGVHCENAQWMKIDRVDAFRPMWGKDPRFKELVVELWRNEENRPTEEQRQAGCGRKSTAEFMARDADNAAADWYRAARGESSDGGQDALSDGKDLDEAMLGLLGEEDQSDPLADHPGGLDEFAGKGEAPADGLSDDLPGDDTPATPQETVAVGAKAPAGDTDSLEGIFDGLEFD